MSVTAIGGDPALRHGVFVIASWNLGRKPTLEEYEVVYSWSRKDFNLGEKSNLADIKKMSKAIADGCDSTRDNCPVGIDWTSSTGFMGRRIQASVLSFFIGYLSHELEFRGYPVVILSPQEVRTQLGINKNTPKENVWKELRRMLDREQAISTKEIASDVTTKAEREDLIGDLRDALLLSYLTAVGRSRHEAG